MFVLHGGSGTGPSVAQSSEMVAQTDRLGFIAVFPNSTVASHARRRALLARVAERRVGGRNLHRERERSDEIVDFFQAYGL